MSQGSLPGLLGAQALFLLAGIGVLWALRPWQSWADVLRMLGVAYLFGVAVVGVVATLLLVAGSGLGLGVDIALALAVAAAGVGIAWRRGHRLPAVSGFSRPELNATTLATAAFALLIVLVLVSFWRVARWQGVVAWDGWAFWVPKAKGIYFFGGLDLELLKAVFNPSYPMLVPALQAIDFAFVGAADGSMLALQYWFLFAGFIFAAWALLRTVVPPLLVWPFLALASVLPELDKRMLNAQGDWPLDIFFALAALCLARWLMTRESWLLGSYGILLAAALATKREGQLLTACLIVAVLAATWTAWRRTWPWVVGVTAAAWAINVPWLIWWSSKGLPSSGPPAWLPAQPDRIPPAFRIVATLLFDYRLWLLAVPLGLAAAVLALRGREVRLAVVYLGTTALGILACVWILWAFPSWPLDTSQQTPIPRTVGALVLLAILFAPLLLAQALAAARSGPARAHLAQ